MRVRALAALAIVVPLAACGGGWFGAKPQPDPAAGDTPEITRPIGPHMVARCPVPIAYDDATEQKIQAALDALPKDSVLRQTMKDYETERDNLRMCQ